MLAKTQQIHKATKASKSSRKGAIRRKYQIRSKLRFFKPHTLRMAAAPKYARSTIALNMPAKFDKYTVLVHPLNTEKANKVMTERNTLVFLVHNRAGKKQIKKAFEAIHKIKPKAVNTLVRPDGKKKAYIRLSPEDDAAKVASSMGMI